MGISAIREFFPTNQPESDAAAKLRLELMGDIVKTVGPELFEIAVKTAISISKSRWDCSVARVRECAGLSNKPTPAPAMKAWSLVTELVQRHVRPGMEGGYRLEPYTYRKGEEVLEIPVPIIPEPVLAAVRCLGGWGALWVTEPAYWPQRMRDFCGAYDDSSLKRDSTATALVRAKPNA